MSHTASPTLAPPPLPNKYPLTLAAAYLSHIEHDLRPLRHWRGEFYRFTGCVYEKLVEEELLSDVTLFLNEQTIGSARQTWPLQVTRKIVLETQHQLESICQAKVETMPAWMCSPPRGNPRDIIAFTNGLLDVSKWLQNPTAPLIPPTLEWFSESVLPCRLNPDATCPRWLHFLNEVLADASLIGLLQEWAGYILTNDTSHEKMMWLCGRSGSGKGTVTRVLSAMVGKHNVVAFSLWSLTQRFTLSSFVGKTLAVAGDAHLGYDTDSVRVIEQIKAITGQDDTQVDRKNRDLLPQIRMATRFIVSVNSLPNLPDAGDTLRRRSLMIPFNHSFEGIEDRGLKEKLITEIPGIILWALAGLRGLKERGEFSNPAESKAIQNRLAALTNPVLSFVEECCEVDEDRGDNDESELTEEKNTLFEAYQKWAKKNGYRPTSKDRFGESLMSTVQTVKPIRRGADGARYHVYTGIKLKVRWKPEEDQQFFTPDS